MKRSRSVTWHQLADRLEALPPHERTDVVAAIGQQVLDVRPTPPEQLNRFFIRVRGQTGELIAVRRTTGTVRYANGREFRVPLESVLLASSRHFKILQKLLSQFFADYTEKKAPKKARKNARRWRSATRLHDSQASKVYRFEREVFWPRFDKGQKLTLSQCSRLVQRVVDYCRPLPVRVQVGDGRGSTSARCSTKLNGFQGIELPTEMRTRCVVLHEIAHAIVGAAFAGEPVADHGPEFVGVLLALLQHIGKRSQRPLLQEAQRRGLRVTPIDSFARFVRLHCARRIRHGIGPE